MIAVSSRTSQSDLNWTLKRISKTETAVKLKSRFKCTKVSTLLVSLASIMCVLLLIPLYIIPKDSAESTYSNFRNAGALVNDITALQPDLSVIVLTYNGAGRIADIVHSLVACGSSWAVEIIIVDNGCSSDVILMLHQLRIMKMNASLRYLALCDNEAYSVANNIGARASVPESRWLLFLNDDVLPSKGFLNNLKATVHVAIARGIKIGGVGGKLLFGDGKVIEAGSLIRSDGSTDNFYRFAVCCATLHS